MTQELVIVILISGLVGLLWLMMLAIWEGQHADTHTEEAEPAGRRDEVQSPRGALERTLKQTLAA